MGRKWAINQLKILIGMVVWVAILSPVVVSYTGCGFTQPMENNFT